MGRVARCDISLGPPSGRRQAIYQNNPRNAGALLRSRHVTEASGVSVLVNFPQHLIKLSARDIAFHLLIPVVVLPAV